MEVKSEWKEIPEGGMTQPFYIILMGGTNYLFEF
jgi:hypothetical protein